VRALQERGEPVRVLVRSPDRLGAVDLDREALDVVTGDLLEPATIPAALEGVTRLYHVAGFISTARRDRDAIHRLNVNITRNLFEAARRSPLDKIVYLASIFALGGGAGPTPVHEDVAYDLEGFGVEYFVAKRKAELYARRCAEEGLPLVFAYPCFCYGPGDVYRSSSKVIELHLKRLLVTAFPGGQNAMDVRDAAAGLLKAMDRGAIGERYLIGGQNITNTELGTLLASITGYPRPWIPVPGGLGRLAGRVAERLVSSPPLDEQTALMASHHWYYDDEKARRELGHTSRPLETTLRDAIDWMCRTGRAKRPPKMA
ncbi:MAG: NAD-dependent epimerase/dehydratase family protein, partial [Deltaproteobacteria bacterium]|nr:NAD-dependent epimerase/dehydratase family protein [Deltaproteobacteria bacterium]